MDGRGSIYTDMDRNTSEELFIRTLMESSVGMPTPTMEMMGFKNLPHNNFRTDSEELFKSWLTNGENHGPNPGSIVHHRPRQASRSFSGHQNGASDQRKQSNEEFLPQSSLMTDESSIGVHDRSLRNAAEKGIQASNLYLAKAWFHSSQPMTRSRSSELRRRYAAMQNSQTAIGMEAMHNVSCHTVNHLKQEFVNPSGFNDASLCEIPKQLNVFMSPPNSSSSTLNDTQGGTADKISSVVSMLKGTLERKRLSNQSETKAIEESSSQYFGVQGIFGDSNLDRGQEIHIHEAHGNFQELSTGVQGVFEDSNLNRGQGIHIHDTHGSFQELLTAEVNVPRLHQMVEETTNMDLECFVSPMHGIQMSNVSREPSVSESSAAAPIASTVFDTCDAPSNSCQTLSICESSMKNVGRERSSEKGFGVKDVRGQMYGTVKDERKQKGGLVRYGSVNSAGSDKGDPTKKRRVERSRKMAEAKERNLTPAIPSDMQSILKRCENLEKEVRSLKLNLAFMNRKDSEQTKQIEELQKQNEELGDEKERLLEEIERIISETGKM